MIHSDCVELGVDGRGCTGVIIVGLLPNCLLPGCCPLNQTYRLFTARPTYV